jgi:aspartyl-tRNA(Asn)/glutamyl-tRNA(Gln) amidotransferase subunit B
VTGELTAAMRQAGTAAFPDPGHVGRLIGMVNAKQLSHAAGRQILSTLVVDGGDPEEIAESEGLLALSDSGELETLVEQAIESEPEAAERVRAGNAKAIGPLVGAVMRETKGRADGGEVTRLIREKLGV